MKFIQFKDKEPINLEQVMAIQFSESQVTNHHTIWFIGNGQKEGWIFKDKKEYERAVEFVKDHSVIFSTN